MNINELKCVIAGLLEDARRVQQLEPNAGTQSRINEAVKALESKSDRDYVIGVVNIYPQ